MISSRRYGHTYENAARNSILSSILVPATVDSRLAVNIEPTAASRSIQNGGVRQSFLPRRGCFTVAHSRGALRPPICVLETHLISEIRIYQKHGESALRKSLRSARACSFPD